MTARLASFGFTLIQDERGHDAYEMNVTADGVEHRFLLDRFVVEHLAEVLPKMHAALQRRAERREQ